MSNFMHKAKEALSDHRDRDRVPTDESTGETSHLPMETYYTRVL
jgi:hypothetical protein